jgi:hypothetical protein
MGLRLFGRTGRPASEQGVVARGHPGCGPLRLSALLWPFPFGTRLGWLTARAPNPGPAEARGRAFLLRGNGAVFSRGFGALCDELRHAGLWADDLRCVGDRWARRRLLRDRAAAAPGGPVVFVGHSCGGRYALHAAHALQREDVTVDLIVCLDVAFPPPVPANVRRAVHLYRTRLRLYPAGPLRPASGSAARLDNHDLDAPGSPVAPGGLHHLNITASPAVRAFVRERILETVR